MTDGRLDAAILRQLLIALAMIVIMLLRRAAWCPAARPRQVACAQETPTNGRQTVHQGSSGVSKRFGGLQACPTWA
jgi:hypothetical protein